jgi:16S rRNA G966 N2-methylase RsmD/predicted metal-binding protein
LSVISAGKNDAFYNAHSYPTKIPPEAIVPFIEHFTKPGEVVLDPFCGSGMTGVAAVRNDRNAILCDLSPGAVHLAYNHSTPCDPSALGDASERILAELGWLEREMYGESCRSCGGSAVIVHTTWAAVYECPACARVFDLSESGFDVRLGRVVEPLSCPGCGVAWNRRELRQMGHRPRLSTVHCASCRTRATSETSAFELARLEALRDRRVLLPIRDLPFDASREMYRRSALHLQGVSRWSHFYTKRNLLVLNALFRQILRVQDERLRRALLFAFTNTAWHATRMRRFNARGGQRPLTGTLYIPQMSVESNVLRVFAHQVSQAKRFYAALGTPGGRARIRLSSATDLSWLADSSVDYVFTDPPFGSNIFYADCNFVWEAWLGAVTDPSGEIVWNRSLKPHEGGKTLEAYGELLAAALAEMRRVLKPGGWASLVFQNSDDRVWRVLQEVLVASGLSIEGTSMLDKKQWSMKGYKGRRGAEHVAFFDLVVHMKKVRRRQVPVELNGDRERFIKDLLAAHLRDPATRGRPQRRLLQYLHAVVIREFMARGFVVRDASLREIEAVCRRHFRLRGNRWYLK